MSVENIYWLLDTSFVSNDNIFHIRYIVGGKDEKYGEFLDEFLNATRSNFFSDPKIESTHFKNEEKITTIIVPLISPIFYTIRKLCFRNEKRKTE